MSHFSKVSTHLHRKVSVTSAVLEDGRVEILCSDQSISSPLVYIEASMDVPKSVTF